MPNETNIPYLAIGGQQHHVVEKKGTSQYLTSRFAIIVGIVLLFLGLITIAVISVTVKVERIPVIKFPVSPQKLGVYTHAAAAVDEGTCSTIASGIMQKGGSAVDAAIAAALCTSTFNIDATGIGGGFFMVIWNQTEQIAYVINAREIAPSGSSKDMFANETSTTVTPLSIAVPGEVAGYWAAHQRFGKLPWKSLFDPTIDICRKGFVVSKTNAKAITDVLKEVSEQKDPKPFANLMKFLINDENGRVYAEGDTMYCPKLANTLQRIAEFGGVDFYNGSLAEDLAADLLEAGSLVTREDLANYRPDWPDPVDAKIGDHYRMISVPSPGSGPLLTLVLNIMAGYKMGASSSQDPLTYHRFVEALKFAYGQRMIFGDQRFEPEVKRLADNLTTMAWADHFRNLIDDLKTHPTSYYLPDAIEEDKSRGTSHLSIVDAAGNAVSMTSSISDRYGSGVVGTRTGIVFNSKMNDFSRPNGTDSSGLPPGPNNFIAPGKSPQSNICPAIFLVPDENEQYTRVSFILGASGGSRIISGVAYAAMRFLFFNENPKQAIDALRLHHQLVPDLLSYDPGMPKVILDFLYQRGDVSQTSHSDGGEALSLVQAIQVAEDGTKLAYSDYRHAGAFSDGY